MKPHKSKVRAQPWLGTIVEVSVQGESDEQCAERITQAFIEIQNIHQLMSFHDENSELTKLNQRGHLEGVVCSKQLCEVLHFAQKIYLATEGAVDITVAPALIKKQFLPSHIQHEGGGSPEDILIEGQTVRFTKPLILDLGGIAKGYAVDQAIQKLKNAGCTSASVNAGGDLRAYGDSSRQLLVRDPSEPTWLSSMGLLNDTAVATSAGYFSMRDGFVPYVDPATGECLTAIPSVTVRAPTCMLADALTKFVILTRPLPAVLHAFQAEAWVQT